MLGRSVFTVNDFIFFVVENWVEKMLTRGQPFNLPSNYLILRGVKFWGVHARSGKVGIRQEKWPTSFRRHSFSMVHRWLDWPLVGRRNTYIPYFIARRTISNTMVQREHYCKFAHRWIVKDDQLAENFILKEDVQNYRHFQLGKSHWKSWQ